MPYFKKFMKNLTPDERKEHKITTEDLHKLYVNLVKRELEFNETWEEKDWPAEYVVAKSITRFQAKMRDIHKARGITEDDTTPTGYFVFYEEARESRSMADVPVELELHTWHSPRRAPPEKPKQPELPAETLFVPVVCSKAGWGICAARNLKSNRKLTRYNGQIISKQEMARRRPAYELEGKATVDIIIGQGVNADVLDGHRDEYNNKFRDGENLARLFNHSSDNPNCKLVRISPTEFWLYTRRPVAEGYPLLWNYDDIVTPEEDLSEFMKKTKKCKTSKAKSNK